ncbi:Gfo/Idh/MocA family protein [Nonlabens marinus]|uniref:Probable oxidoreductase n=1 Tax=Nonlabens marinus S1-08 TaxID=1454201 RepID=W8VZY8_9FLAO|nr:Gfo/Idh/MocA family oxidoreductase [Nonlabens marinus]BAO55401.1 probable oxidoreductase [Nonlabens marinus S1-08]
MENLKFAVVGCGNIGKRHAAVIDKEEHANLVAICDIDSQKTADLNKVYGVEVYTDFQEMLSEAKFDILCICTPHGLHAPMSIQAARSKKHILVEKPMALTSKAAKEMIEEAEKNKVNLWVVKQNRYNKPIRLVKQVLDQERLGKIFLVQTNVLWNRHQRYYEESPWRGSKRTEGGALHTQVSHFLDLLIWWFGEIIEAKSLYDTLNHDIEIEDAGVAALRFENNALGSLNWTTCVYNANYEGSITIIGELGTIKIGGRYLNKIDHWDVQAYPLPENEEFNDQPNTYSHYKGTSSNHDKLINDLIGQIIEGRRGVVEGPEGLKSIEAIEKIYGNV